MGRRGRFQRRRRWWWCKEREQQRERKRSDGGGCGARSNGNRHGRTDFPSFSRSCSTELLRGRGDGAPRRGPACGLWRRSARSRVESHRGGRGKSERHAQRGRRHEGENLAAVAAAAAAGELLVEVQRGAAQRRFCKKEREQTDFHFWVFFLSFCTMFLSNSKTPTSLSLSLSCPSKLDVEPRLRLLLRRRHLFHAPKTGGHGLGPVPFPRRR